MLFHIDLDSIKSKRREGTKQTNRENLWDLFTYFFTIHFDGHQGSSCYIIAEGRFVDKKFAWKRNGLDNNENDVTCYEQGDDETAWQQRLLVACRACHSDDKTVDADRRDWIRQLVARWRNASILFREFIGLRQRTIFVHEIRFCLSKPSCRIANIENYN